MMHCSKGVVPLSSLLEEFCIGNSCGSMGLSLEMKVSTGLGTMESEMAFSLCESALKSTALHSVWCFAQRSTTICWT